MIRRAFAVVGGIAIAVSLAPGQPPGGPGGPGGGPFGGAERKLLAEFDANKDGWLSATERVPARAKARQGGRGGFPGFGRGGATPEPGPKVSPADVRNYPGEPLYAPNVLRTLFLTFEGADWEKELEDFHGTDVDVPCTLAVDGKTYKTVGVHFRGMSSYSMVRAGLKRSFNVSLDTGDAKQRPYGAKTLNLLNAHEDPSFLSPVLYSHVARQYMPAPKANLVKVVVNGESWGVYASVQQFDKEFLKDNTGSTKGSRWKVRGSPGGGGGLDYVGDDVAPYKRRYELKGGDDPKAWAALVKLCKTLSETPADKLEAALRPMMDVDEVLWFLTLDVALINCDGYWVRASDYSLHLDGKGKFHVYPGDMNEAFRPAQGPGVGGGGGRAGGGPGVGLVPPFLADALGFTDGQKKQLAALQAEADAGVEHILTPEQRKQLADAKARGPFGGPGGGVRVGGGANLDPLVALDDARKPLRSKVLAVPALRAKYLADVRAIADKSLDWKALGPVVAGYRALVDAEIEADTRKLSSIDAFRRATADAAPADPAGGRDMPLRAFADQRRAFLLKGSP